MTQHVVMTVPDDAPRSGHRTCSSSIENRHQTKFVITSGVIREAVIELVRHRL
jgi:hypothetical protein